jgi:hypothetical protein
MLVVVVQAQMHVAKQGVESRRPGGGSTYADVIKSLEARCMVGTCAASRVCLRFHLPRPVTPPSMLCHMQAGELSGSEYDSYTHSSQGESSQGSGSANSEQGQGDSDADEVRVTADRVPSKMKGRMQRVVQQDVPISPTKQLMLA